MRETLSLYRGHDFLPATERLAAIPPICGQDGVPTTDKIIHLHYTATFGEWWITELDPDTWVGFGYARLTAMAECAEWGYIPLDELEAAMDPHGNIVDRDLRWQPTRGTDIPGIGHL
ncbi:DUF2958 domain-containing protein [Catellatospora sp. NPDC049111]|uniref:DUF2958 domain-containing protein n=1 Tax=Catellatospora sp. NPDC049111 TaxID=3155271 RepID=UPI0033ECA14E